jgi:hypothetical protein
LGEFPEFSRDLNRDLVELMADPIVHMTMAADSVRESELYNLLRRGIGELAPAGSCRARQMTDAIERLYSVCLPAPQRETASRGRFS